MSCTPLSLETVWFDKNKFEDAERHFYESSRKLQWIKSSSKVEETGDTNSKGVNVQDNVCTMEDPLIKMNQVKIEEIVETAAAPAQPTAPAPAPTPTSPIEKKPKDKKKEDKSAAKNNETADGFIEKSVKEEKGDGDRSQGKQKKGKEDEGVKEKQNPKKKKGDKSGGGDGKKGKDSEKSCDKKEEMAANVLKDLLVPLIQPLAPNNADSSVAEPPPGLAKERESPPTDKGSEAGGEGKKSGKKSKKNKNKKNQQAAEKLQSEEQQTGAESNKKDSAKGAKDSESKKQHHADSKKDSSEHHSKKKGDKKESKKVNPHCSSAGKSSIADEIARARQQIKNSLDCDAGLVVGGGNDNANVISRLLKLEDENRHLRSLVDDVRNMTEYVNKLVVRVDKLEKSIQAGVENKTVNVPQVKKEEKDDDDDVDLFGSDEEEDVEMEKIKAERLRLYEAKKQKKPALVAKSNIILDVKPWGDETDLKVMEKHVREIACDGLLWGASKLVPLAYGIHKLQISSVIEDEKVSVDWLQEQIEGIAELVQSVDIAAFNKV